MRVISFASGKGGVGKTSLVSNMGLISSAAGSRTLLIDGDWSLGKLAMALGVRPKHTIDHLLRQECTIDQLIEPVRDNLSIIAAPSGVHDFAELNEAARNHLFFELDQISPDYDRVFIDHSSGIHFGVLQFAAACHQHVLVTHAEPTSFADAYAIMKVLSHRFAIRNFQLIVTHAQDRIEAQKMSARFVDHVISQIPVQIGVLEYIPWDARMAECLRTQKPIVERYPTHSISIRLREIQRRLEETNVVPHHGMRFFSGRTLQATA